MGASGVIIELKGVSFSYAPERPVLKDLDFSLARGQQAGLIGPTGSGKTTLLHLIMGLSRPAAGRVEVFGRVRETEADFREVRARIGFLFQDADDQLFCPTVAEDVAFGPLNLGFGQARARALVRETLDRLGLAGFEERVTYKLSAGEKKLVALATVLAMQPEVLLLDEPTAGLDEETTGRIVRLLRESALPFLIVSHDRPFLTQTAKTLLRLENGSLRPEG